MTSYYRLSGCNSVDPWSRWTCSVFDGLETAVNGQSSIVITNVKMSFFDFLHFPRSSSAMLICPQWQSALQTFVHLDMTLLWGISFASASLNAWCQSFVCVFGALFHWLTCHPLLLMDAAPGCSMSRSKCEIFAMAMSQCDKEMKEIIKNEDYDDWEDDHGGAWILPILPEVPDWTRTYNALRSLIILAVEAAITVDLEVARIARTFLKFDHWREWRWWSGRREVGVVRCGEDLQRFLLNMEVHVQCEMCMMWWYYYVVWQWQQWQKRRNATTLETQQQ